jgi:hypothetical protein
MADAAAMRAWGKLNGFEHLSEKGPLPRELKDAYAGAHPNGTGELDGAGYPDDAADEPAGPAEPDKPGGFAETRPRDVAPKGRPRGLHSPFRKHSAPSKPGKSSAGRKAKPARPRSSTADLAASLWRVGAKLATPMPPLHRTLRLQSVVVGPLWDERTAGTIIDRWLQPIARTMESGDVVAALVGPELGIGLATWYLSWCERATMEPNPAILQGCAEITRAGLVSLMRVGGDAFKEQMARDRDDERAHGATVDAMMAWIMSPPADPDMEEQAMARMMAAMGGEDLEHEPAAA